MANVIKWVATLDDGTTVSENSGEYTIIPGQRMPWVRLTQDLAKDKKKVTSLRLNYNGRTIHLPRKAFSRFNLAEASIDPSHYSLSYVAEGEVNEQGELSYQHYVDLVAHFEDFEVHYLTGLADDTSWITVTRNFAPMAATPR